MKRPTVVLLCLAGLLFIAAPAPAQRHARLIARIDSLAGAARARSSTPGLSLAVLRDGEMVLARGYGLARMEDSTPATEHTVYRIASVTKLFTAAAVMRLSETRRLRLQDDVTQYLPSLPSGKKPATVRHLLSHTSGFPLLDGLDRPGYGPDSVDGILEFLEREPPVAEPGERFVYSNSGYYLLGHIIEQVAGRSWLDFLAAELFATAGLSSTGRCEPAAPQAARGYQVTDSVPAPADTSIAAPGFAAGGLCSTVLDLVRWQRAIQKRQVINALSWRQMTEPVRLADGSRASYGYGVTLGALEKHRWMRHGGAWPGFSSQLVYYPDDDLIIAILANGEDAPTRLLADQIARVVLGIPEPRVKNVPLAAGELARYTGSFDLQGQVLRVQVKGERLETSLDGGGALALLHQGHHEFVVESDPSVRFYFRMSGGRARGLVFRAGTLEMTADRVPEENDR